MVTLFNWGSPSFIYVLLTCRLLKNMMECYNSLYMNGNYFNVSHVLSIFKANYWF